MCQSFTYFWVGCGHVTYKLSQCPEPSNCGPAGSIPNTATEMDVSDPFCIPCTNGIREKPLPILTWNPPQPDYYDRFDAFVKQNFAAHKERSERREAEREELSSVEERDLATDDKMRYQVRLLTKIPPEKLTVSQAHHLVDILRKLKKSESQRINELESFIAAIPDKILPGQAVRKEMVESDELVQSAISTVVKAIPEDSEHESLVWSLEDFREQRLVERGEKPYLHRTRRTAAICRLVKRGLAESEHEADCPICLGEYYYLESEGSTGERPVVLPCNHVLGHICAQTWFSEKTTCPKCRRDYTAELQSKRNQRPVTDDEGTTEFQIDFVEAMGRSHTMPINLEAVGRSQLEPGAVHYTPAIQAVVTYGPDGQEVIIGQWAIGVEFELTINYGSDRPEMFPPELQRRAMDEVQLIIDRSRAAIDALAEEVAVQRSDSSEDETID